MARLPTGTVTLVFTDIEGSTRLLHHLGDAYEDVLATHRRVLRAALSSHGGIEVDTQGDALFYAFGGARDAVAGAIEAQRALFDHDWLRQAEVRVRMGIHSGEPSVTAEGYVGADVHLAARICSAAHGGQVLVSDATAHLLAPGLEGIALRSLGEHSLKDIEGPVILHQLVAEGMPKDFAPLRTPSSSHPTNLPARLEALIGREEDVNSLEVSAIRHNRQLHWQTIPIKEFDLPSMSSIGLIPGHFEFQRDRHCCRLGTCDRPPSTENVKLALYRLSGVSKHQRNAHRASEA